MARRMIALALWTYFGWNLAAILALALGLPTAAAPIGGLVVGVLALVKRRRLPRPSMGTVGAHPVSE